MRRIIDVGALFAVLIALAPPAFALGTDGDAAQPGPAASGKAPARKVPAKRVRAVEASAKQAGAVVKPRARPAAVTRPAAKQAAKASPGARQAAASRQLAARPPAKAAAPKVTAPRLSAAQIVQKHLAARGGVQAWKAVQAMAWNGKIELGYGDSTARSASYVAASMRPKGKAPQAQPGPGLAEPRKQVQAPFAVEMKRPEKSRMEVQFAGKTAVQVYDGANGWLLRPYLNRNDWEPFTPEQLQAQRGKWELGGPLIDAAARGTKVKVVAVEAVDGRAAYKLELARKEGGTQHVWIDAKSFLDVKVEGTPRRMDGKEHTVWVTQRDFRPVQGLMVPFATETAVDGYPDSHKVVIEKVAINPKLDDARFAKPRA